jgi:methyl-accepting chemotaxis protein
MDAVKVDVKQPTGKAGEATEAKRFPFNLSHLTVARKMALITAVAVMLGFAAIMAISANNTRDNLVELGEQSFLTITKLLANNVAGGLRWNKADAVEEAYNAFATADGSAIASIRTFNRDGGIVTRFDSDRLQTYDLEDAVKLSSQSKSSDGVYLALTPDHVVAVVPAGKDAEGNSFGTLAVAWSLSDLHEQVQAATMRQIMVAVAILIGLVILLPLVSTRMLGRPLAKMTEAMAKLAGGDNTIEVPATDKRDDIGAMARTVQVFKENALEMERLRAEQAEAEKQIQEEKRRAMMELADSFEASVKNVVDAVSSAATEMQATAESMSVTAERSSAQAVEVDQASQEASANVETVASATEELTTSSAEIGQQVSQSSQIASNAAEQAHETNEQVAGLVAASQRIGEVIELINGIAEQTNLLALNATIEAARAGDAGKGFAVVASEVKSLANQTAKATEEIAQQIAGIQTATTDAAEAIQGIGATIEEINQIASTVAAAVENVQEASSGTKRVSQNIVEVTEGAHETGRSAQEVLSSASILAQQGESLRAEVDSFIQKVRTA